MDVSYSKLSSEEVSERLERSLDGKNASTCNLLDHIEVEKLLAGEADGEGWESFNSQRNQAAIFCCTCSTIFANSAGFP